MRYRFHQDTFIGDRLYSAGDAENRPIVDVEPLARAGETVTKMVMPTVPMSSVVAPRSQKISYKLDHDMHHIPGPHWEPMDEEAKAWCRKCGHEFTGEMPDVLDGLEQILADAQSRMSPADITLIATGVIAALQSSGLLGQPQPKK